MAGCGAPAPHKVVLCGQFGVGKSSIMRRFVDNSFIDGAAEVVAGRQSATMNGRCPMSVSSAVDNYRRTFPTASGRRTVQLELWDTAGLERFRTMSASYYSGATAALVCYAVDDRDSFDIAAEYILEVLDVFGRCGSNAGGIVFLCGNKTDVSDPSVVSAPMADSLAAEYDNIVCGSFRVSCRTGNGVKAMFEDIAAELETRALEKADRTAIFLSANARRNDPKQLTNTPCTC